MEQSPANPLVRLAGEHAFEGHTLVTIEMTGRQAWLAFQVSEGLGYEKSDHVVSIIRTDLADEVEEGTDYQVLRGEDLALLKAAAPGLVAPNAPSVMVLFESGIHLVAMRARTERARTLRRWLASEVLPSIRRTGSYTAGPPPKARPQAPVRDGHPPALRVGRPRDLAGAGP